MLDFGPSHAFWCFPFERYNGILGSYPTNKKAVEVQFMRKFVNSQSLRDLANTTDPQLCSLLPVSCADPAPISIASFVSSDVTFEALLYIASSPLSTFENINGIVVLLPPLREGIFSSETVHTTMSLLLHSRSDVVV